MRDRDELSTWRQAARWETTDYEQAWRSFQGLIVYSTAFLTGGRKRSQLRARISEPIVLTKPTDIIETNGEADGKLTIDRYVKHYWSYQVTADDLNKAANKKRII